MDKTDRLRDYGLAFLLYEQGLGICGYELIRELFIFTKLILNSYLGNNVKIGGGVCIYDTDFHSLDPVIRRSSEDLKNRAEKSVVIDNDVFIGAKSIILKGVTIGENSVIGAGSVVTKSVPANQIWAGNPAKFIRSI